MEIKIDDEFRSLIPSLSEDEYRQLEKNVKAEGCRDALVLWDGILLDGHNRYKICTENDIEFKTVDMQFDSRYEAKEWIIKNQFGRRNLNPYQRAELVLQLEELYKEQAKENQLSSLKKGSDNPVVPNWAQREKGRTDEKLAKIAGVGKGTIQRARKVKQEASPELLEQVRSGEKTVNAAYEEIRKNKPQVTETQPERSDEHKAEPPKPKSITEKLREKVNALEEEVKQLKAQNKNYEILVHELNNRLQTAENKDYFENQKRMEKMLNE